MLVIFLWIASPGLLRGSLECSDRGPRTYPGTVARPAGRRPVGRLPNLSEVGLNPRALQHVPCLVGPTADAETLGPDLVDGGDEPRRPITGDGRGGA